MGFLGGGVSLPSQLEDLGERRELPQRGPGRSPGRQRILGIFQGRRSLLVSGGFRLGPGGTGPPNLAQAPHNF